MTNRTIEQIKGLEELANLRSPTAYVFSNETVSNIAKDSLLIIKELQEQGNWQPIETAPKDGTAILVCEGENIGVVLWRQQAFTNGEMEWCAQDCCDGVTIYKPTHWMPLPKPPIK